MHVLSLTLTAALSIVPLAALSETGSFDSDGVELHYTDEGTGPTVVFLHAFAGTSALWQSAGLAPLEGFRTITFDARGHGESDKPVAANAYGQSMVDDLAALFDARGLEAAHVVGYSMGAETALRFAAEHPDRVLSLTVAGSGWSGAAEAGTYGFIAEALMGAASFGDFMAAMAPEGAETPGPEDQAALMDLLAAHGIDPMQSTAPLGAVAAGLPEIIDLTADELAGFDFPVLGLAGETDAERANVERLADGIDDFRFVLIPGADHLAAPLSPVFTEAVQEFLEE